MFPDFKVFVVIPGYNEAQTIASVVRGVLPYATPLVVDDGSIDGTAAEAEKAGAHVLRLSPNRGYEGALDAGVTEAARLGAQAVVTFDADGQFDPKDLESVIRLLADGEADLVLGQRPAPARIGEALFNVYARLRFGIGDIVCGLKGYRIDLYNRHGRFDGGTSINTELAIHSMLRGARTKTVPVTIRARETGAPRFGTGFRANRRILKAVAQAICADLKMSLGLAAKS
ncbi:glycosyltransferase family 2 protein [Hwanghaeella sp.]|uniref:glycosyltransferase family 2 protein n=1 Tax=Hwanghaeella sp. TaxID=2605943 RepID=UPI003CCBB9EC